MCSAAHPSGKWWPLSPVSLESLLLVLTTARLADNSGGTVQGAGRYAHTCCRSWVAMNALVPCWPLLSGMSTCPLTSQTPKGQSAQVSPMGANGFRILLPSPREKMARGQTSAMHKQRFCLSLRQTAQNVHLALSCHRALSHGEWTLRAPVSKAHKETTCVGLPRVGDLGALAPAFVYVQPWSPWPSGE